MSVVGKCKCNALLVLIFVLMLALLVLLLLSLSNTSGRPGKQIGSALGQKGIEMASGTADDGAYVKLARRLAHNDKKVRDSTVKNLRRWLSKHDSVSKLDLMKIWKGLFYCFWMSDKRPVQRELSNKISRLIQPLAPKRACMYYTVSLETLCREWTLIDKLRMDKFMMLARMICYEAISYMQKNSWDVDVTTNLSRVLANVVMQVNVKDNRGLCLHIAEVFIDELERVLESRPSPALPFETLKILLRPFFDILCYDNDEAYLSTVEEEIADRLLECLISDEKDGLSGVVRGHAAEVSAIWLKLASRNDTREANRNVLYSIRDKFLAQLAGAGEELEISEVALPKSFAPMSEDNISTEDEDSSKNEDSESNIVGSNKGEENVSDEKKSILRKKKATGNEETKSKKRKSVAFSTPQAAAKQSRKGAKRTPATTGSKKKKAKSRPKAKDFF